MAKAKSPTQNQDRSLELDPDVLAWWSASGSDWQDRANEVLRNAVGSEPGAASPGRSPRRANTDRSGVQFGPQPSAPGSRLKKPV